MVTVIDEETPQTPQDYDAEDGWDDDSGIEVCPHCETHLGGQGGIHGPVVDQRGREFESLYDTEPGAGPYFCTECWPELEAEQRSQENHGLSDFA